jgi:hypothetical protein
MTCEKDSVLSDPHAEPVTHTSPDNGGLQWTVHPARERPAMTVAALLVIIAFGGAVELFAEQPLWGMFAAIVLCLALHRFFFHTRYEMSDEGVRATTLFGVGRLAWDDVRRVRTGSWAAWLEGSRGRRMRARGLLLLFGQHRAVVIDALQRRLSGRPQIDWEEG